MSKNSLKKLRLKQLTCLLDRRFQKINSAVLLLIKKLTRYKNIFSDYLAQPKTSESKPKDKSINENVINNTLQKPMARREFINLSGTVIVSTLLSSCGLNPIPTNTSKFLPIKTATQTATVTTTPTVTSTPKSLGPFKPATYAKLPRWRGFNLLNKWNHLDPKTNKSYDEWNFDFMVENGFDFVRLAIDYAVYTISPGLYKEQPLRELDQAIAWARQRGIHTNLDLHHPPGYSTIDPKEPRTLFIDGLDGEEARRRFAMQWRMFAIRYKGIPSNELSFNLVNEPDDSVTKAQYLRAVTIAVDAIRQEDPNRLIIADGFLTGSTPVDELAPLKIAQSVHCYAPARLTHYGATWTNDDDLWPIPSWPLQLALNQYLHGDFNPDLKSPIVINGYFTERTELSIRIQNVTTLAQILIYADGVKVNEILLEAGPGEGEWKTSTFISQWNVYEATYDRDYTTVIPSGTHEIKIEVGHGDWLSFSEIRIRPYSGAPRNQIFLTPADLTWGVRQEPFALDEQGNPIGTRLYGKDELRKEIIEPWVKFAGSGIGVHSGEFGVYNKTPHPVALAWMKDLLELLRDADFGWALWQLSGGFGPLNSNRTDVKYEDYNGHKLDRAMLELLKQG